MVDPQRGAGQLRGADRRVPAGDASTAISPAIAAAAFLLAVCAGLLRPEAWPFLGLYGLWLLWRRALPARLIIGAGAGVVALWLLPEWWGSGDLLRAAHRAKDVNPGAPTYADSPVRAVLEDASEMLTAPLVAGLVAALAMVIARRDRAVAFLAGLAICWLGLVAYMTSDGFSGNQRYLIAPVALLIVLGGAGAGWGLGRDHRPCGPGRSGAGAQAPGARARALSWPR